MNAYDREYLGLVDPVAKARAEAALAGKIGPKAGPKAGQEAGQPSCSTCSKEQGTSACDGCGGTQTWEIGGATPAKGK